MSGPRSLADFEGSWKLARTIRDRASGRDGILEGRARFDRDDTGLVYSETGLLTFPDTPPIPAERRYLWRQGGPGAISVLFEDGRPFHEFHLKTPEARHWCDPDIYEVDYDFGDWPGWWSVWTVKGPRKSYSMTSHYTRADGA